MVLTFCGLSNASRVFGSNLQVISAGTWGLDGNLDFFVFKNTSNGLIRVWCPLSQANSNQLLSTALSAKVSGSLVNVGYLSESPNNAVIDDNQQKAGGDGLVVKIEVQ